MLETDFTRLVGCSVPIQLAGMGGASTPGLAAAVSNACRDRGCKTPLTSLP